MIALTSSAVAGAGPDGEQPSGVGIEALQGGQAVAEALQGDAALGIHRAGGPVDRAGPADLLHPRQKAAGRSAYSHSDPDFPRWLRLRTTSMTSRRNRGDVFVDRFTH